jgi:hypothetical protein
VSTMQLVEEMDQEENAVRRLFWICMAGHEGVTAFGAPLVCPQCCHGGPVPARLECQHCGATRLQPTPVRGGPPASEGLIAATEAQP